MSTLEVGRSLLADLEDRVQRRCLMVFPVPLLHLPIKFGVVILSATQVEDHIVVAVLLPKELLHLHQVVNYVVD